MHAIFAVLLILLQRPCLSGPNTAPFAKRKNRNHVAQPVPSTTSSADKKNNDNMGHNDQPISNLIGVSLVGCFNDESDLALLETTHEEQIHSLTLSQSVYILVNAALVAFILFSGLRALCKIAISKTRKGGELTQLDKIALMYVPSNQVSICHESTGDSLEDRKFKHPGSKETKTFPNRSNVKTTPSKTSSHNMKKKDTDPEKHERTSDKSKDKQKQSGERGSLSSKKAATSGKLQR
jgi:hypothetical protein